MSALFSKPKVPEVQAPEAPPPAPEKSDADVSALASAQRRKFFGSGGRGATMLTGGGGTAGGSSVIRFLGGAART